jgi:hypothetical protein
VNAAPPPPSADLYSLGRRLDSQVTAGTGAGEREVEETLLLMKQAHHEIVDGLIRDA